SKIKNATDAILVFVTVEKNDDLQKAQNLITEIEKFAFDTGHKLIFLSPFAHLSNNLASSKEALEIFNFLHSNLNINFSVVNGHFGSDKEALIHLYGHPGNTRYREF